MLHIHIIEEKNIRTERDNLQSCPIYRTCCQTWLKVNLSCMVDRYHDWLLLYQYIWIYRSSSTFGQCFDLSDTWTKPRLYTVIKFLFLSQKKTISTTFFIFVTSENYSSGTKLTDTRQILLPSVSRKLHAEGIYYMHEFHAETESVHKWNRYVISITRCTCSFRKSPYIVKHQNITGFTL